MVDKLATRVCMKECDRRSLRAESEEKRRYWALRARKYGASLVADERRQLLADAQAKAVAAVAEKRIAEKRARHRARVAAARVGKGALAKASLSGSR